MNVETLYDPGTGNPLEDRFVVVAPFYAVFDGVSGLYHPAEGWRAFDGKSGGQRVVDIAERVINNVSAHDSAFDVTQRINAEVREFSEAHGLSEPHDVPGAAFTIAKVTDDGIELVQGGDVFAVWQLKDGTTDATPNQGYANEASLLVEIEQLMQKHGGNKEKMWDEYMPILKEAKKRANTADGYVVLNGDPAGEDLWFRKTFAPGELKILLLVSDGLTAFEETMDKKSLAHTLIGAFEQGNVQGLLDRVRHREGDETHRHIKFAEATAIALQFV